MTARSFRRRLFEVAVAALPALGSAACCPDDVYDEDAVVSAVDPVYAPLIERCIADDSDCTALCARVLADAGLVFPDDTTGFFDRCLMRERADGWVEVETTFVVPPDGCGRRPSGLVAPDRIDAPTAAGAYLAACAHLEAASVIAFARLARDLARHGAPRPLVHAAVVATDDEARHARVVAALARRCGAAPPPVVVAPRDIASLEALALDNAVEGGVHEALGVAIAATHAARAADPIVRTAMAAIARDEARHVALADAIDAWLPLAPAARRRVERARLAASDALPGPLVASLASLDRGSRAWLGVADLAERFAA